MTMALRNRASDTSTAFGGDCCMPRAVRSRDSTTMIRTKLVVMMTMDGASDSTVISPTSCTTRWVRPAPVPRSMLMADPPCATSCASAPSGQTRHRAVVISDSRTARFSSAREGRVKTEGRLISHLPTAQRGRAAPPVRALRPAGSAAPRRRRAPGPDAGPGPAPGSR
ncbi:hypothetical protein D3C72_1464210 [compost metagenome]